MNRQALGNLLKDQVSQAALFFETQGWKHLAWVHFTSKPTPASRPRLGRRGRVHYAATYQNWRDASLVELQEALTLAGLQETWEGPLAVLIEIAYPTPKQKPKNGKPYPRGDLDNYAKGPLDTITELTKVEDLPAGVVPVWYDDTQVASLVVVKYYEEDKDLQGIYVDVYGQENEDA